MKRVAFALYLLFAFAEPSLAQTPDPNARARALYEQALELNRDGRNAEAIPVLEESLSLLSRPGTAYLLAWTHNSIANPIRAREITEEIYAGRYGNIADPRLITDPTFAAQLRALHDTANNRVARITVTAPEHVGVVITIDAHEVAQLHGQVTEYRVNPGVHRIEVTADDRQRFETSVTLDAGGQSSVNVAESDLPYRTDRMPAHIIVTASEPTAQIEITDVTRGQGMIDEDLPPGPYEIRVRYRERERIENIVLAPGEDRALDINVRSRRLLRILLPIAAGIVAAAGTTAIVLTRDRIPGNAHVVEP